MAKNKGANSPEFSVVDVRATDPVKDGDVWRIIVSALVKHRSNTPPNPPREVAVIIDGQEIGRRNTDDHGRIEMEIKLPDPRKYYLEAQIVGTSFCKGKDMSVVEEKKKSSGAVHSVKTSQVEIQPGEWALSFIVFDKEGQPVKGAFVEVIDKTLPSGLQKLPPTDKAGVTSYTVTFAQNEKERYLIYRSGTVHRSTRVWR